MRLFWRRPATAIAKNAAERRPVTRVRPLPSEPVEVQIMGPSSLDIVNARDVSESGLGVYVPHAFAGCDLSAELELVITLPRCRSFMARGVIKHVTSEDQPAGYFGVEFTGLSAQNRARLRAYVEGVSRR